MLQTVAAHGALTREHIRRLCFSRNGHLVSVQAVNARLKKLVDAAVLETVVVSSGRGAGPYAYSLGPIGSALIHHARPRRVGVQPIWHVLEIAEFRVALQELIDAAGGRLSEWQGEPLLRSIYHARRAWPIPDALVHWQLRGREGAFLLEWDRGSESVALLTAKLVRYQAYYRALGHQEILPGLGLRPRLAIVVHAPDRATRVVRWIEQHAATPVGSTVFIALASNVLPNPLGLLWWRSDKHAPGSPFDD
jgi:hypothetical protein